MIERKAGIPDPSSASTFSVRENNFSKYLWWHKHKIRWKDVMNSVRNHNKLNYFSVVQAQTSTSWRGVWHCLNRACWLSGFWCFGTWGLAGPGKDAPCRASQSLDGKRLPRAHSSNANQPPRVLPHHFLPWALAGLSPCPHHLRARPQF